MSKKYALIGLLTVLLIATAAGSAPGGSGGAQRPFAALLADVGAFAAPTPVNISNSRTYSSEPLIGVDANGKAYAVWYEHLNRRTFYFSNNKSGAWSTPVMIEGLNYDTEESGWPVWAVSPSGAAHLTFFDAKVMTPTGLTYDVFDRAYENGAWGPTSNVSSNAVQNQSIYPGMAINPVDNYAYVVWSDHNGAQDWREIKYRYRKADSVWVPTPYPPVGSKDAILPVGYGDIPRIAVDGMGTAHMVWGFVHGRRIWYSKNQTPQNKATWTTPIVIKADAGNEWSNPTVSCDNAGNAYVLWMNGPADWDNGDPYNPNNPRNSAEIFVRKVNSDSTLGWEENVSQSAAHSYYGSIAVNPGTGDLLMAWTEGGDIQANAFIGGKWTGPGNVTNNPAGASSSMPAVAVDISGRGHLVYVQITAGSSEIMYLSYRVATSEPAKVDFNGDGLEDILWRNSSTGQNAVWFMGSSAGAALKTGLQAVFPAASPAPRADGVLRDISEVGGHSTEAVRFMTFDAPDPSDRPAVWDGEYTGGARPRGPASFHQGLASTSGGLQALALSVSGYAYLPSVTDASWKIVGTGDFNGDTQTDILWRNSSTGYDAVWFMNGTTVMGYEFLPGVADTNWQIVGTGDFNGDGKTDILWRNVATGENAVWFIYSMSDIGYVYLVGANLNWQIVGTGDFNKDGRIDILWRNSTTGENAVWVIYSMSNIGFVYLDGMNLNWQIVGTGDFNKDGRIDILWRNSTTGENAVWFMNGTTLVGGSFFLAVADLSWQIVNR